jgi:hypothetical protein
MSSVLLSANPDQRGADVRLADVLRTASGAATAQFEGHPELEVQVRNLLGGVFLNLDLQQDSIDEFARSADLAEREFGKNDRRALHARLRHVQTLLHADRGRDAEAVLADLSPRIARVSNDDDVMAMEARLFQAAVHRLRGRYNEGQNILRELDAQTRDAGPDDLMRIRIIDSLAFSLQLLTGYTPEQQAERWAEVERLAVEMEERSSRVHGVNAMPTIRARVTLARCMLRRGDAKGAAAICRQVLAVSEGTLGHCHTQRQQAQGVLAEAINEMGDVSGAADLQMQLLDCTRARDGKSVALVVRLIAALPYLNRAGRFSEGEAVAREFGVLLREMGGGHGDMQIDGDLYLAHFVSAQGRLDEADALFGEILARRAQFTDEITSARLGLFVAHHVMRRGRLDEAQAHLVAARNALGDLARGTTPLHRTDLIEAFVALYRAWDKPDQAAEYERLLGHDEQGAVPGNR